MTRWSKRDREVHRRADRFQSLDQVITANFLQNVAGGAGTDGRQQAFRRWRKEVSMRTFVSGNNSTISWQASMPEVPGRRISMMTISGWVQPPARSLYAPIPLPHDLKLRIASNKRLQAKRTRA